MINVSHCVDKLDHPFCLMTVTNIKILFKFLIY